MAFPQSHCVSFLFVIRSPLPHGQRSDTEEICLFTRDEPNMTSEQTQRFYKKLLQERGVKGISEVRCSKLMLVQVQHCKQPIILV